MSNVRELGEFTSLTGEEPIISELYMRFIPLDLVAHWKRCGMVADFLAHFLGYNFENKEMATNIISTVLNEVLENAVKFSVDKSETIALGLRYVGEHIEVEASNKTDLIKADNLAKYIQKLHTEDLEDLFVQQIEHTAAKERTASGLGLITLKKDYEARVGCQITEKAPNVFETIVRVCLPVEKVEQ